MQYSQEHLKTMVYAEFGGQTECIMGNWKIENWSPDAKPSFQLSTIYKFWKKRDMSQFVSDVFIDVTYCPGIVIVSLGRRFR